MKNSTATKFGGLSLALGLLTSSAAASPITLNSGGTPQPANGGTGTIEAWISGLVTTYNTANNPDLPVPGAEVFRVNTSDPAPSGYADYPTFSANRLSITIPTDDFDYVALHWGGPGGGVYQAIYIGDIGGVTAASLTFNAPSRNGLSWYDVFRLTPPTTPPPPTVKVPEGGSTFLLLSAASIGLAGVARQRRDA